MVAFVRISNDVLTKIQVVENIGQTRKEGCYTRIGGHLCFSEGCLRRCCRAKGGWHDEKGGEEKKY